MAKALPTNDTEWLLQPSNATYDVITLKAKLKQQGDGSKGNK